MTWNRAIKWAIPLAVVAVWGLIFFRSTNRPDILQALAGCYTSTASGDPDAPMSLQVNASGWLLAHADRTRVTGYQDKSGDALLPEKKLVFDRYNRSRIEFDAKSPLIIRASVDHTALTALDDVGQRDVVFRRIACGPS